MHDHWRLAAIATRVHAERVSRAANHAHIGRSGDSVAGVALALLLTLGLPACSQEGQEAGGDADAATRSESTEEDQGFAIIEQAIIDDIEQAYVSYPSGDLRVTGYLFVNPFSEHDVEPCIIFNHGGIGGVNETAREKCRWLAKQGFIVFAPSYRGEDDSEGEVEIAAGEVEDVIAALLLLEDHPGIRPGEFVLMGTSHGALISVLAAARPEVIPLVRAVVAGYGVMDIYTWYQYLIDHPGHSVDDELSRKIYGHGPEDKPEAFARRHAMAVIPKLGDAPILLIQGDKDDIVPRDQAVTMFQALLDTERRWDRCRTYEHGAHGFLFWDDPSNRTQEQLRSTQEAWVHIMDFVNLYVGEREEGDWDGD